MNPEEYQSLLLPYAYNILGSVDDARDVVQEAIAAYLKAAAGGRVQDTKAYLVRSVLNGAINARKRNVRQLRPGEVWLPEPVATDDAADRPLLLKDVLSYSLLVLMERLPPLERAVFILRESFDYAHDEIAVALDITPEHSRQLLSRARKSLFRPPRPTGKAQAARRKEIVAHFVSAIRAGNLPQLEQLMAEDIRFHADGGGKAPMAAGTCLGAREVAELQLSIYDRFLRKAELVYTTVNHQPALLTFLNRKLTACQVFDLHPDTGVIQRLNAVLDPQKLKTLSAFHSF